MWSSWQWLRHRSGALSHKVFCHDSCFSYWLINLAYDYMIARLNWLGPTSLVFGWNSYSIKTFCVTQCILNYTYKLFPRYLSSIFPSRPQQTWCKYSLNLRDSQNCTRLRACGTDLGAIIMVGRKWKFIKRPSSLSLHNFCTYQSMLLWCKFID